MSKKTAQPKASDSSRGGQEARTEQGTPSEEIGPAPVHVVGGMKKFDPYDRPRATATDEALAQSTPLWGMSYESALESASGPGADAWRRKVSEDANIRELCESLRDDERYAEEYKSQRSWEEYEKVRPVQEERAERARKDMLASAEGLERQSIPTPEGESLITHDVDKLQLTQGEYSRIARILDRAENAGGKSGFKRKPEDILKQEYARAMSGGGPGGGAVVRAVYRLAEDSGYDIHAIVDEHRKPYHHEALRDAEGRRYRANLIDRSVPKPPFPHPNQLRQTHERVGTYGRSGGQAKAFVPREKGMLFAPKSRKAPWK